MKANEKLDLILSSLSEMQDDVAGLVRRVGDMEQTKEAADLRKQVHRLRLQVAVLRVTSPSSLTELETEDDADTRNRWETLEIQS